VLVAGLLGVGEGQAQGLDSSTIQSALASWTVAEVRKIDPVQKKITLRHQEIKNLNMPPMTMVFHVKDVRLLDGLDVGSKVTFLASKEADRYVVIDLKSER
jgi:Cu/Ag efflux protein CusF